CVNGLRDANGAISMARGQPDSATSGWFICINDQASLDFGGARNPDGQGFAAFGRVVQGMDVVRKIQQAPNTDAQRLTPPIRILKVNIIRCNLLPFERPDERTEHTEGTGSQTEQRRNRDEQRLKKLTRRAC